MADISALSNGLQGVQRGLQEVKKCASEIASANTAQGGDPTASLVEMKVQRTQVEASAKVVQTAADLIGTLFDEKA